MTTSGSGTSRPTSGSEPSEPESAVAPDQPDHDGSDPVGAESGPVAPPPAVPPPPAAPAAAAAPAEAHAADDAEADDAAPAEAHPAGGSKADDARVDDVPTEDAPGTTSAPSPGGRASSASGRRHRQADRTAPNRTVFVVPGLLVVALVLLVVGLVTGASVWLAVSLGASVLAAVLLVVERVVQRRRAARATSSPATAADASAGTEGGVVDVDPPAVDPDDPDAVWVVDGRPRYHTRECETLQSLPAEPIPRAQALEDGFVACSLCEPGTAAGAAHAR